VRAVWLLALVACGTDEPTDARTCDEFTGHLERTAVRCGVNLDGVDAVKLLGTPLFVEPDGAPRYVDGTDGIHFETWGNRWGGDEQIGAAVVLVSDQCQWLRCEYTR